MGLDSFAIKRSAAGFTCIVLPLENLLKQKSLSL